MTWLLTKRRKFCTFAIWDKSPDGAFATWQDAGLVSGLTNNPVKGVENVQIISLRALSWLTNIVAKSQYGLLQLRQVAL